MAREGLHGATARSLAKPQVTQAAHLARPRHLERAREPLLHLLAQHIWLRSRCASRCRLLCARRRLTATLVNRRRRLGCSCCGPLLGCLLSRPLRSLLAQPLHLCLQLGTRALLLHCATVGRATAGAGSNQRVQTSIGPQGRQAVLPARWSDGTDWVAKQQQLPEGLPHLSRTPASSQALGQQACMTGRGGSPPVCAPPPTPSPAAPDQPSCGAASHRGPLSAPHAQPWLCSGVTESDSTDCEAAAAIWSALSCTRHET